MLASADIQALSDTTIDEPLVDLSTFAYYVTGCLYLADFQLYAARITYD